MNGLYGVVRGSADKTTGRVTVIMDDDTHKQIKEENVIEVLTDAVVRIIDLKNAPQLNGMVGQVIKVAQEDRYQVLVEKTQELKNIREGNLELIKFYSLKTLETLPPCRAWDDRIKIFDNLNLPIPFVCAAEDVAYGKFSPVSGRTLPMSKTREDDPEKEVEYCRFQPSLSRNQFRLVAISGARDSVCEEVDVSVLEKLAQELVLLYKDLPVYFLIPHLCVKKMPILKLSVERNWPLYLQACSELVILDGAIRDNSGKSVDVTNKAWCTFEKAVFNKLLKPIYTLGQEMEGSIETEEWLWSSKEQTTILGSLEEGVINNDEGRALLDQFKAFGKGYGEEMKTYRL